MWLACVIHILLSLSLFFFFWPCWVFIATRLFSSCGEWWLLSSWGASLLQRTDSRALRLQKLWHVSSSVADPGLWSTSSAVVAHRLSCSGTCGIFLDQESNLCLMHWQADSLPLSHQGSPLQFCFVFFFNFILLVNFFHFYFILEYS